MLNNQKITLYCRTDDVYKDTPELRRFIDIFTRRNIPIHLAVIPGLITSSCRLYLKNILKLHNPLIEIGQHGFKHLDHSFDSSTYHKYEFGKGRNYEQQINDIRAGRKILGQSFHRKIRIFSPPWNGFDSLTIKILREEKFGGLSVDSKILKNNPGMNFNKIPMHISYNMKKTNSSWFVKEIPYYFRKIKDLKTDHIGILFHHDQFQRTDFKRLEMLLNFLCRANLSFEHLSEAENPVNKQMKHVNIIYFLTYQFLPKSFNSRKNILKKTGLKDFGFFINSSNSIQISNKESIYKKLYLEIKNTVSKKIQQVKGPIAIFLSGGLDSTSLLHVLREATARKIFTLTAAFDDSDPRLKIAKILSRRYATNHQQLIIKPEDLKLLKEIYSHDLPAPIGDNGLIPIYAMFKRIKEFTNNVFTGDGADCLFGGLSTPVRHGPWPVVHYFKHSHGEIFLDPDELKILLEKRLKKPPDLLAPLKQYHKKIRAIDPVKQQILFDLNFLAFNRIDYLLQTAQINKVNIHIPFLDKKLVRFILQLPSRSLDSSKRKKEILIQTFKNKIPLVSLQMPKEGFSFPFALWYNRNVEFVIRTIAKGKHAGISKNYIKYLIRLLPYSKNYRSGMKIWLMLNFILWHEHNNRGESLFDA